MNLFLKNYVRDFWRKKNGKYHAFFTTYRILLSEHAENYLKNNNFLG